MFLKKYEANSLEKALSDIKNELGPNALILSTKQNPASMFKKGSVEVTAAYEQGALAKYSEEPVNEDLFHRLLENKNRLSGQTNKIKKSVVNSYVDSYIKPRIEKKLYYEEKLIGLGFSSESAKSIGTQLHTDFSKKDLESPIYLMKALQKIISPSIQTLTLDVFQEPSSWSVIGMPGSGKTSSLVKLALYLKSQSKKVVLVTKEQRKVLGKSELAAYAKLIRVPCHFERHSKHIELMDSKNDEKDSSSVSTLLVVDASSRLFEVKKYMDNFFNENIKAIIFTKVDLVSQKGFIYDVLKYTKLPLLGISKSASFKVPFQFLSPKDLCEYLLKG